MAHSSSVTAVWVNQNKL